MKHYKLPVNYEDLPAYERRHVRMQYIEEQNGLCFYCKSPLDKNPPASILSKKIDWNRFPKGFTQHPIHLQHCHTTKMTEGAVHAYCNAVMWQYEGK